MLIVIFLPLLLGAAGSGVTSIRSAPLALSPTKAGGLVGRTVLLLTLNDQPP